VLPRARFVAVWIACFALLAGTAAGALFLVYAALPPDDQRAFARMLDTGGNDLFVFAVILAGASGPACHLPPERGRDAAPDVKNGTRPG